MSEFTVYGKSGCGFCDRLVDFMKQKDIPHTKLMLGEDYTVDEFVAKFGHSATFPRVVHEGECIGGMKDTVKYLVENKYV